MGILVKEVFSSATVVPSTSRTSLELVTSSRSRPIHWMNQKLKESKGNFSLMELLLLTSLMIRLKTTSIPLNEITNQNDMIRQAHAEVNLFKCIIELCRTFTTVKVIEKYGNYVRVRVDRLDKSIGSVFGQVEGYKGEYDVSEYSVSQTTLEQIFQTFADVHFSVNV